MAVAYNYSLITLFQTADLQTPLACISLVPVIALILAAIRAHPRKPEPPIYDRQVDYTIGIPLMVTALAVNELLPSRMTAMFWAYQVDLLTLPFFVAGSVAIIFGSRVLWRQRLAIVFLFLIWPYPFEKALLGVLNGFTNRTLAVVEKAAVLGHLAKPAESLDSQLLVINHHGTTFTLNVVAACSGVNGIVGFLLVGSVFAATVRGPLARKLLWLAGGVALLWAMNVARILVALVAAKEWGAGVAADVLDPFVALAILSLGVGVMILLIKPLGMDSHLGRIPPPRPPPMAPAPRGPIPVPSLYPPPLSPPKRPVALAVPRIYLALVITLAAALLLGISNYGLRTYDLVTGVTGETTLIAFPRSPTAPPGWQVRYASSFAWAKPLFGYSSIWDRYSIRDVGPGPLPATVPVVADVIDTPDLSSLAYGLGDTYAFNGYTLADVANVGLAGGVTAQAMSYTSQLFGSWSLLYWIAPVKSASGQQYERVVLYIQDTGHDAPMAAPVAGGAVRNIAGSLRSSDHADRTLLTNRSFLVAFATSLIRAQAHRTTTPPGAITAAAT